MEKFIELIKIKQPQFDTTKISGPYKVKGVRGSTFCAREYEIYCPTHGYQRAFGQYILDHGCPKCSEGGHIRWNRYTTEDFVILLKSINDEYDYSEVEFVDLDTPVKIICKKHGAFFRSPQTIISTSIVCCPMCQESSLERIVRQYLDSHQYEYIQECSVHEFEWLHKLRIDFYLQQFNIAIECQGEQHFKVVDYFNNGKIKTVEDIYNHDQEKYNLCKENGVKMFYYTDANYKIDFDNYIDTLYTNMDDMFDVILKIKNNE